MYGCPVTHYVSIFKPGLMPNPNFAFRFHMPPWSQDVQSICHPGHRMYSTSAVTCRSMWNKACCIMLHCATTCMPGATVVECRMCVPVSAWSGFALPLLAMACITVPSRFTTVSSWPDRCQSVSLRGDCQKWQPHLAICPPVQYTLKFG